MRLALSGKPGNNACHYLLLSLAGISSGDQIKVEMLPGEAADAGDEASGQTILQFSLASSGGYHQMSREKEFRSVRSWE